MRLREPAAWTVLSVMAVTTVLGVIELSVIGPRLVGAFALGLSARIGSPALFIALGAAVASCVLVAPIARARLIATLAVVMSGIALLVAVVVALLAFSSRALKIEIVSVLVTLIISGLVFAMLIKLFQVAPTPTPAPMPAPHQVMPPAPVDVLPPRPPDPQLQPTWQPDAAAGAAWTTAGDAAAGAPASGWGTPGESVGWHPIPQATGHPPIDEGPDPR